MTIQPWREAHPSEAIDRIVARRCDIFVDPFTCISENAPDDEVCDPCRLVACGAHDLDWDLLDPHHIGSPGPTVSDGYAASKVAS